MDKKIANRPDLDCHSCAIRANSVFCTLNPEDLQLFNAFKSFLRIKAGQTIFYEGGFPNGFFIVYSGKVKISKLGDQGREKIVRFAREGDLIGYRSLLSEFNYACSAFAIDEVLLCFIPKDLLKKLIEKNSDLAFRLMKLLADDLGKAEQDSTNMAQKQVRERVAEALVIMKDAYGLEHDNLTINVKLSREEIAGIAGTARETATRLLSEFNTEGLIAFEGKKIKILDERAIYRLARV